MTIDEISKENYEKMNIKDNQGNNKNNTEENKSKQKLKRNKKKKLESDEYIYISRMDIETNKVKKEEP